jgi:hypothetical protein
MEEGKILSLIELFLSWDICLLCPCILEFQVLMPRHGLELGVTASAFFLFRPSDLS